MKNYAITIKIDDNFSESIVNLQKKLNQKLSINDRLFNSSDPHIMFVAGKSNVNEKILIEKVSLFSKELNIKCIEFNGLAVFLNIHPTIFIRWKKKEEIEILYQKCLIFFKNFFSNYHESCYPEIWLPKTTIATNDTNLRQLNEISDIVFPFEFPKITNVRYLCLLSFDDKKEYLIEKFEISN